MRKTGQLTSSSAAIVTRREASFSNDLTLEDRRKLRSIVIKTHKFCFRETPTTLEVDKLIDAIGPEVGRQLVLEQIAAGRVG